MFNVDVREDIVIVGQNPERADLDNPHGYVFGSLFYVEVSNGYGRRWQGQYPYDDRDEANKAAESVRADLACGFKLLPENWIETRPVYGSRCYEQYGPYDGEDGDYGPYDGEESGRGPFGGWLRGIY
jgi:hypothetical protein